MTRTNDMIGLDEIHFDWHADDLPECPKGPDGNYIFPTYTEDPPFDLPVNYPDCPELEDSEPDIRWNE